MAIDEAPAEDERLSGSSTQSTSAGHQPIRMEQQKNVGKKRKRRRPPVRYLFLWRADPDAGSVVLEQVLGTGFDASGTVGVLAFRIDLPRVGDGVVALHGRTFLLAHSVVEEIATSLQQQQQDTHRLIPVSIVAVH